MRLATSEKVMSEEEYIQFELQSDIKHEYVNGKLIDLPPGESALNNKLALNCYFNFRILLKNKGYNIFAQDVKVKMPDQNKYYYPDVFITKEPASSGTTYIMKEPELIIEVLSDSTRKYDTVDKFINYKQFPSLHYYLLIEPETVFISVFSRAEKDEWYLDTYAKTSDIIDLPALGISITVGDIYEM